MSNSDTCSTGLVLLPGGSLLPRPGKHFGWRRGRATLALGSSFWFPLLSLGVQLFICCKQWTLIFSSWDGTAVLYTEAWNTCSSSRWCHPAISSSVFPFSSCPQSLPASGSFPVSQLFAWGGQSTGVSASASVLPMNTQDWSPLGWTSWISLQSKGLSRVFSNTTVQKHQF